MNTSSANNVLAICFILYTPLIFSVYYLILKVLIPASIASGRNQYGVKLNYIIKKTLGFVLFGVIPAIIAWVLKADLNEMGISFGQSAHYWYLFILFPLLIISVVANLPKKESSLLIYPELRLQDWSLPDLILSTSGWFIYILAFEFLFRGVLFFTVYNMYGLEATIAVNVFLYAAVHLPKGWNETLGAIPFGILLCLLAWITHSFLLPFIVHSSLAISNDWFSIKHNPDMRFVILKKIKLEL